MGLGKTAIILALIQELQLDNCIVIGPKRVVDEVWPAEIEKWDQFRSIEYGKLLGSPDERGRILLAPPRLTLLNFDNVLWTLKELGDHVWPYENVFIDESTRLKGYRISQGTKRSKGLGRHAHKRVNRWVNLTGTPAPNGLLDLWGPHWFIDGGYALGRSFTAFSQRWFYQKPKPRLFYKGHNAYADLIPFAHAQAEIETRMRATTLSIRTADYFPVAEPVVNVVEVNLPVQARREYRRMERSFFASLAAGDVTAATAAVKSNKLLQMANGAIYHEDGTWSALHEEKIEALKSILEEAAGANVLVAYHYRSDAERLRAVFPQAVDIVDKKAIERWNAGEVRLLLAHPKSAGHGLNLQDGGNRIVFFGEDWNLEDHLQIIERIGPARQKQSGYDRPVYVTHIIAKDTIDELVVKRRDAKESVMEALLERMKATGEDPCPIPASSSSSSLPSSL
jgi:SNF2 family DNA or RNA helicase